MTRKIPATNFHFVNIHNNRADKNYKIVKNDDEKVRQHFGKANLKGFSSHHTVSSPSTLFVRLFFYLAEVDELL